MSAGSPSLAHRRLRAPREHGQALIEPPRNEIAEILAANRARRYLKLPRRRHLADSLTWQARRDLIAAAVNHTRQYRDVAAPPDPAAPVLMAGHQPELFHAGVWFKNCFLASLATEHQATAINLIIDNDTVDSPTIRVPSGSRASPLVETVAMDASAEGIPFEQRTIMDPALFESFAERVGEALQPWIAEPLVGELWRHARAARQESFNLGQVLARARHALEGQWGLNTLEVPLSTVVAQPSFRCFALARLWNADDLRRDYNSALQEYRAVNHIRSRAQPVPDLATDGEWCETPFWIWTNEQPLRKRLFVRHIGDMLQLTDRQALTLDLPADEDQQLEIWVAWEQRGVKIRPRALMTTMYARLTLSDLFVHGIGGAKYDEVTDAIIRRSMNIEPPKFLTATATVQLPLEFPHTTSAELQSAQHEARELRYHAEQHMHDGAAVDLVARKQKLLQEIPLRGSKKSWHQAMSTVNEALLPLVAQEQQRRDRRAAQLAEQHRLTRLLGSREFSFCLFPAEFLRTLLLDLSRAAP
jgi:hypothetical protein